MSCAGHVTTSKVSSSAYPLGPTPSLIPIARLLPWFQRVVTSWKSHVSTILPCRLTSHSRARNKGIALDITSQRSSLLEDVPEPLILAQVSPRYYSLGTQDLNVNGMIFQTIG